MKNKAGGITLPNFRLKQQRDDSQNSMLLAEKQTHITMEQN